MTRFVLAQNYAVDQCSEIKTERNRIRDILSSLRLFNDLQNK